MHALIWLKNQIQPTMVDDVVRAKLPGTEVDPVLHNLVKRHMVHGPCGVLNRNSPCMKNGRCTKGFPKPLLKDTRTDVDGYPQYRRRSRNDGGSFACVGKETEIDNRWVVPYNPVLLRLLTATLI